MIEVVAEVLTKSGRVYRSFSGVDENEFSEDTPDFVKKPFAIQFSYEEARQDAHFLL